MASELISISNNYFSFICFSNLEFMAEFSTTDRNTGIGHSANVSKDISSPFFIHHSENYNFVIVTLELTSTNFSSWKRSFLLALSIRNKQGFLDGKVSKPSPKDSLYYPWIRCNNLIVAWVLRLISPPIASTVF